MNTENQFWNGYYSKKIQGDNPLNKQESSFARYCSKYIRSNDKLIDLGCGNGRDSLFFEKLCSKVYAVDLSQSSNEYFKNTSITFKNKSIGDLFDDDELKLCNVAYSRFSLHSVDKQTQDNLFKFVAESDIDLLCIETRSVNDPRFGIGTQSLDDKNAFVDTHYRRFQSLSDLTHDLIHNYGFNIIEAIEDFHNAHYGDDKAVVIRIICSK